MERPESADHPTQETVTAAPESPTHETVEQQPIAPAATGGASRTGRGLFWGILSGCLLIFVLITAVGVMGALWDGSSFTGPGLLPLGKVAVLPLEGAIFESRDFIETLEGYAESRSVKAIVVRIDSPGGLVVPSQEMYEAILRVRRESGKPVVASIANTAASGGYYVAVACDPIIANRGSVTGSIGVIAQWLNYEELARWAKLDPQTIKSGRWKDVPNPLRELSEEERSYYQRLIDQLHGQFISAVVEGRKGKLAPEQVRALSDGRVFLGDEAMQLKLIDRIGTLDDAISVAGEAAGLGSDPAVHYPKPRAPGLLEALAGGEATAQNILRTITSVDDIRFLYRWN